MINFEPINNESVVSKVVNVITNSIIENKLKAKDKIPNEFELSKQLKVSRTSVREALKILSAFGIIKILRGDGTYISDSTSTSSLESLSYSLIMNDSSKQDIADLRLMLDLGIYFLLIPKIKNEDILLLESKLEEMEKLASLDESKENIEEKYIDSDIEFHLCIARLTKNKLIEKIYSTIMKMFKISMIKTLRVSGKKLSLKNHYKIVKVLKEKDVNKIIEVSYDTFEEWKKNI